MTQVVMTICIFESEDTQSVERAVGLLEKEAWSHRAVVTNFGHCGPDPSKKYDSNNSKRGGLAYPKTAACPKRSPCHKRVLKSAFPNTAAFPNMASQVNGEFSVGGAWKPLMELVYATVFYLDVPSIIARQSIGPVPSLRPLRVRPAFPSPSAAPRPCSSSSPFSQSLSPSRLSPSTPPQNGGMGRRVEGRRGRGGERKVGWRGREGEEGKERRPGGVPHMRWRWMSRLQTTRWIPPCCPTSSKSSSPLCWMSLNSDATFRKTLRAECSGSSRLWRS
jgi:hypothetical protein